MHSSFKQIHSLPSLSFLTLFKRVCVCVVGHGGIETKHDLTFFALRWTGQITDVKPQR